MPANDRLHALDAVRAYALLLGVVLHSAAAFLEGFPIPAWYVESSTAATVIYYVIHMFRMSAFFLMAGFFARMVVERRGTRAFVRDRLKRIAIPLFLFGPVVIVMIPVGFALGALAHGPAYLQELAAGMNATPAEGADAAQQAGASVINTAHLWFLYYLLIFYALALGLRLVIVRLDRAGAVRAGFDRVIAILGRGLWGPALIALPLMIWFMLRPTWNEWIGLPAPVSLIPNLDALVGYGLAFGLGWLLHRQVPVLLGLRDRWAMFLVAAVALSAVCLRIAGTDPVWAGPSLAGLDRIVYIVAYMMGIWFWIFAFVGTALRFLSHESRINRYLADASYWIYLMHLGTIIFFVNLLRPFELYWAINLVIYIAGSMAILLATYHYLVRFTWIGAVLNGSRRPRPDRAPPASRAGATG